VKIKPIIIVLGEPYSTFSEIIFKLFTGERKKTIKRPLVLIGSKKLLDKQMLKLNYRLKINLLKISDFKKKNLKKNLIYLIDVDFKFKKTFDKISTKSQKYITVCFDYALKILKDGNAHGLVNGPVSKKHFLEKKYLGVTEYLKNKSKTKKDPTMLIYNPNFSVCPITTHLPLKNVAKKIKIKKISYNVIQINNFYKKYLRKKPYIAILGLNPHCETTDKFSEEEKIIKPAIKSLLKKNIRIKGPFSADTFFFKKNIKKFDVAVGMYHDQVLIPMKTLFGFDAINLTIGLPFIRLSPDHGTNNEMIGRNKSNPRSLYLALDFLNKINEA
tara:strand:+ start:6476 stop:7462 length:987 start_codon:yes stop_codon:yes gene_type:complete